MSDEEHEVIDTAEDAAKPRKAIGYPVFLLGLLLASALGAVGGGLVAYSLKSAPTDLTPLRNDVASVKSSVSDLKSAQTKLGRQVKSRPAAAPVDITGLEIRLAELETALENIPAPAEAAIDPEIVARLEALQNEGSPALDLTAFEERLDSLETAGMPDEMRVDMRELYERIAELEISVADFKAEMIAAQESAAQERTAERAVPTTAMPFPKQALLNAASDQAGQGGFFKRQVGKHIRVKDANDPLVLIEAIEAALADEDIETAKAKFDQLPSIVRSAGQDWRNSLD